MSNAQVAQSVEHATENRSVGGSIPPLGTTLSLYFYTAVFYKGCYELSTLSLKFYVTQKDNRLL